MDRAVLPAKNRGVPRRITCRATHESVSLSVTALLCPGLVLKVGSAGRIVEPVLPARQPTIHVSLRRTDVAID